MASYGRLQVHCEDANGNISVGCSVTVYKQGADSSSSGLATVLPVRAPGAIIVGDVCSVNFAGSPTRAVSGVSATTVTVGAPGLSPSTGDRISCLTALPTLYADETGATTTANPLTSDAAGDAFCYLSDGLYDVYFSGGVPSLAAAYVVDVSVAGGTTTVSNVYPSGTGVAHVLDTSRTLVAGDKLLSVRNATVEKASLDYSGGLACSTLAASGAATLSTTLAVTGATSSTGITNTGAISTTTDVTLRRILSSQGTAAASGDFTISGGWGATATRTILNRGTDPDCTDTSGWFSVTASGGGYGANPTVQYTYKDGAFATAPIVLIQRITPAGTGTDQLSVPVSINSVATDWTMTWLGTPINSTYGFSYLVIR